MKKKVLCVNNYEVNLIDGKIYEVDNDELNWSVGLKIFNELGLYGFYNKNRFIEVNKTLCKTYLKKLKLV